MADAWQTPDLQVGARHTIHGTSNETTEADWDMVVLTWKYRRPSLCLVGGERERYWLWGDTRSVNKNTIQTFL